MLFIQRGNSWNTIQFGYYFLYISAIYTGYGLYLISKKLPKVAASLLIVTFLFLTPISSVSSLFNLFNPPNYVIAKEEVEALTALSLMEDGIVLIGPGCDANTHCSNNICPGHCFDENAYVSAISGKETFVSDMMQQEILLTDYNLRMMDMLNLFKQDGTTNFDEFVKKHEIKYIYLKGNANYVRELGYEKFFDEGGIVVYRTNIK